MIGIPLILEVASKVKTNIIVADFSNVDAYDNIKTELASLDIGILGKNWVTL